jgi:hypothetical protein
MSAPTPNIEFASCKSPTWPKIKGSSVFLAGSIEMGRAIEWQADFTAALSHLPVTVPNPRCDDWDKSWTQDVSNAKFKEQVDWETDHLEKADVLRSISSRTLYLRSVNSSWVYMPAMGSWWCVVPRGFRGEAMFRWFVTGIAFRL